MREEEVRAITRRVLEKLLESLPGEELLGASTTLASEIAAALRPCDAGDAREAIAAVGARLGQLGFFAGTSGNVSARLGDGRILITPSGLYKGALAAEDIVTVSLEGTILEGAKKPTSEMKMHLAIYRERPDCRAVVHAHPPYSTGFAAARVPLERKVLPEAILILGSIPLVEYSTPSTDEVPSNLVPHLRGSNTFLLANHGALTLGSTLAEASHRMETLELYAKVLLLARLLGGEALLSEDELRRLAEAHPQK